MDVGLYRDVMQRIRICSLDLHTMDSGPDVVINTAANVRRMAKAINDSGVLPEIEVFDSGDIHLAQSNAELVTKARRHRPTAGKRRGRS